MLEIRAERAFVRNKIDLYVMQKLGGGVVAFGLPLFMQKKEVGEITDPTMSLSRDEAQALMDELWICGLRPTEGAGSAGSLAATERHLSDMQKIAIALLKKDGVSL